MKKKNRQFIRKVSLLVAIGAGALHLVDNTILSVGPLLVYMIVNEGCEILFNSEEYNDFVGVTDE